MTEIKPQFLDALTYAGKFDRQHWRDILTEGVVETDDLKVQAKATPNMSVDVLIGKAYVQGDQATTQGHYRIYNDATVNKSIAASDPTNPRKDRVIAQVKDSTDIGGALDEWELQVLTGTPAGSPVAPALPDDALDLALVAVGAGVTTITNANITDQRSQIDLQNLAFDSLVTIATAQTITGQKTHTSPLFTGTLDGWIAAGETWTYASATTITVPAGAASKYQKGDKIKLTQTTVKYFYVIGVADTLLTITGGTDYTLVSAAITSPYYSKIENPQGFPILFNWTPTYSASGSMTYTSVTTHFAYFRIIGNTCEIHLRASGTTGGTVSKSLFTTLPVNNIDDFGTLAGYTRDTAAMAGMVLYNDSNRIIMGKYDDSNYGLGTERQIVASGSYKI